MVKIRQVDVAMLDKPKASRAASRQLTPRARERLAQQKQFERMLTRIGDRDTVFEIRLEGNEKALTVRQRLMKAAEATGKEVVVRKSEKGWLVGMSTPDRKSRRGRRKASATA
ncbi:MAG: hypothetical protein WD830_01090 [Chloroflexota bacterium]